MAPTPTTKFGLLKPEVGKDNNEWGDTLNGTLDQIDGLLGTTGTPAVADIAARDALFPNPAIDTLAIVKALGYQQRFGAPTSGPPQWLSEGVTRAAGPVITSNSKGIIGNGVADDAPFLAAADTDAIASGGRHELDLSGLPTRCFINSDLTLNAHFRPNEGKAKIYVGVNKTLTIAGQFDPALHGVFDHTMPGAVRFTGPIAKFNIASFDIVGDNVVDDGPAWTFMFASVPDNCIIEAPIILRSAIATTMAMMNRSGITIRSAGGWPHDSGSGPAYASPQIRWNGAVGGTIMSHLNNGQITFEGWVIDVGTAAVGIEMTQLAGALRISTHCTYRRCTFIGGTEVGAICVRIGHNAIGNCELHGFEECHFQAPLSLNWNTLLMNGRAPACGGFMTAGSHRVDGLTFNPSTTNVPGANAKVTVGMRARVSWAGTIGNGPGGQNKAIDGFVTAVGANFIDLDTAAIANVMVTWAVGPVYTIGDTVVTGGNAYVCFANKGAASAAGDQPGVGANWQLYWKLIAERNAAVGVWMVFGQPVGYAVVIEEQNSHRQQFVRCHFFNFLTAIYDNSGSHTLWSCNFGQEDIDVYCVNNSMMCHEYDTNGESSLQHLVMSSGGTAPYSIMGGRLSNGYAAPGKGFIENSTGSSLTVKNFFWDNWMASGTSLFDFSGCSAPIKINNNSFVGDGFGISTISAGFVGMGNLCTVEWEGGDFQLNDNTTAGRIRKIFVDKNGGRSVAEQVGVGFAILPALDEPITNDAYLDPQRFTFYRNGRMLRARFKDINGVITEHELQIAPTHLAKNANYNVSASDDGAIIRVDTTAGDVAIGVSPMGGTNFEVTIINIGLTGHQVNVNWGGGATYNGFTNLITASPGTGWRIRETLVSGVYDIIAKIGSNAQEFANIEIATVYIDIGAGGNATPNPVSASSYRYRIAGAATINAPLNPLDGMNFKMEIFNNTAGPITPTLDAVFPVGYGAIAAGKSRSRIWQYDGNTTKWKPMAAVTEDY